MPIVRFPALMKYYVNNQSEVLVHAETVAAALAEIVSAYPSIQPHLFDSKGELRRHFNIFVNGVHMRELDGMQTRLADGDKVLLMASAAGG